MDLQQLARETADKIDKLSGEMFTPVPLNDCKNSRKAEFVSVILSALNKAVEEKDEEIAELLAALNNIQGELFDFAILFNVALLEIPNHKKQITDYIDKIENMAFKLTTKHKVEDD